MKKKFCGGIFFDPKLMIELEKEYPISVLYYLTNKDGNYGIEIVKIQFDYDSKIDREEGHIDNISRNENEVLAIINKLKDNYVTPIIMNDIIEDMKYEITPRI